MYMYVCSQVHTILNEVCRVVIPVYTNRDVMMLRRLSACQITSPNAPLDLQQLQVLGYNTGMCVPRAKACYGLAGWV